LFNLRADFLSSALIIMACGHLRSWVFYPHIGYKE
jgi:hypothetical protein